MDFEIKQSELTIDIIKSHLLKVFRVSHGICSLYGLNSPSFLSTILNQLHKLLSPFISKNYVYKTEAELSLLEDEQNQPSTHEPSDYDRLIPTDTVGSSSQLFDKKL